MWTLNAAGGELLIRTGVSGRAARLGHRLIIAVGQWHATVNWSDSEPVTAELTVDVQSFQVLRGEGGIKSLSGPEKAVARSNALRSLNVGRFPRIRYAAEVIDKTSDGYRLTGALHIHGASRKHVIDLCTDDLGEAWRLSTRSTVRQSDFGVKPYSLFLGSIRIADEVTVSFTASRDKLASE